MKVYDDALTAEQVKEMVHAIESKKAGLKVHLRNSVASAQGCMLIFQGIYLSQKLGRPVTRKEIIDYSMTQLASENNKACDAKKEQAEAPQESSETK